MTIVAQLKHVDLDRREVGLKLVLDNFCLVHLNPVIMSICLTWPLFLNEKEGVIVWWLAEAQKALFVLLLLVSDATEDFHLCLVVRILN